MRSQRVYDVDRRPIWQDALGVEEHAVFHFDRATGHHRNAHGLRLSDHWNRTIPVFDSLAEAEAYAHECVRESPSVECRVVTRDSTLDCPVATIVNEGEPVHIVRSRAIRRIAWGTALLAIGIACFCFDWYFDWFYLIGVLLGVKFCMVGITRIAEGCTTLRRGSATRAQAERGLPSRS